MLIGVKVPEPRHGRRNQGMITQPDGNPAPVLVVVVAECRCEDAMSITECWNLNGKSIGLGLLGVDIQGMGLVD
jgi:hypothetical protein